MAESWVAHAGRRRHTGCGHVAGGNASTRVHVGARVGRHVAGRAGRGPTGIVGPGKRVGAVMQLLYTCAPLFNRFFSQYFLSVGLCSHTFFYDAGRVAA